MTPKVFLITGIPAAGKSTVAQGLAERLPLAAHVRGDSFRRAIVSGRRDMSAPPSDEALAQLRLRYRLMAQTADTYADEGITAIAQDVIVGPILSDVVAMFRARPLAVIVLAPSVEVIEPREGGRAKSGYQGFTPHELDHALRTDTPRLGLWVDSSAQTAAQTVDEILERADREALV
jgi:chloramphenicol 3-O-phosphotransferase